MLRECVSAINDVVTFEMTEKNFEAKLLANELSKEGSDVMINFGVAETALQKGFTMTYKSTRALRNNDWEYLKNTRWSSQKM